MALGATRYDKSHGVMVPQEPKADIANLPQPCDDKKRILGSGLGYQFQNLKTAGTNAQSDVPLNIALPDARFIMVAGCDPAHLTDSLFMHFNALGKLYTTATITPIGNEFWFPFCQQPTSLTKIGLFYEFNEPLPPTVYFDIGQEAAASAYFLTFLLARSRAVVPGSMFASIT